MRLPPETRQQLFTDAKGKQEYHTLEMAKWLAGKDGRLEPDVVEWHMSARGSKRGLVVGYEFLTGKWGHEGEERFCGLRCAMVAGAEAPTTTTTGAGGMTAGAPQIAAPRRSRKTFPAEITGRRLQQARKALKLKAAEFATAVGYGGAKASRETVIHRLECGMRPVPSTVGMLALMFEWYGLPKQEESTTDGA